MKPVKARIRAPVVQVAIRVREESGERYVMKEIRIKRKHSIEVFRKLRDDLLFEDVVCRIAQTTAAALLAGVCSEPFERIPADAAVAALKSDEGGD